MTLKRTAMKRGTSTLARTPMARGAPMRKARPKKRDAEQEKARLACEGQPCYLTLPGLACRVLGPTVVPCHSNEYAAGKGMGLKSSHIFTIPGCDVCHRELDQGLIFTKAEKRELWRSAYARWAPVRERLFGIPAMPLP